MGPPEKEFQDLEPRRQKQLSEMVFNAAEEAVGSRAKDVIIFTAQERSWISRPESKL